MDDADLEQAILRGLAAWRWLPETDLLRRLAPAQVVRYRRAVVDKMAADGLVSVRQVGDEPVIALTEAGQRTVAADQPL